MGIVTIRKKARRGARRRALTTLAVVGVVGIGGLVAGWGVSPVEPSEIAPADVVALRFPADWSDDTTASTPPAKFVLASAVEPRQLDTTLMFSPYQTYSLQSAQPNMVAAPEPQPRAVIEPAELKAEPAAAAASTRAVPVPERRPVAAPRPPKDSGALFNDAQLASIKARLKLTPYQEQYWPQVASALRDIGLHVARTATRKHDPRGAHTRTAELDPNGDEIQRLKSAAFPLIMSMNDEQKREVRMLAQVMGLQQAAASF